MNLLFVFSDQQRYSALGANAPEPGGVRAGGVVRTPNLDRMAAQGMVCDSMFSNHPLCSPFRAMGTIAHRAPHQGADELIRSRVTPSRLVRLSGGLVEVISLVSAALLPAGSSDKLPSR